MMTFVLFTLAGVAYASPSFRACGNYMPSSGRSSLRGVLKVLAKPGMQCIYGIAFAVGFVMQPFRRRRRR